MPGCGPGLQMQSSERSEIGIASAVAGPRTAVAVADVGLPSFANVVQYSCILWLRVFSSAVKGTVFETFS